MNSKVWLTVFGAIALLSLGGAGYYAFSSYGKYKEAMDGWDAKVSTIENLERRVPYPNKENAQSFAKNVETYNGSVSALLETLKGFQPELNTELKNTDFQQLVKTKVEEFRVFARQGNLEINTDMDFQLGFDAYASSVPAPGLVPVLDYELKAIDHLLRRLVECGATKLIGFERDPIPGESGGAEKHDNGVVHKYPVRLRFNGSHESFQKFVNELANEKQFFYIVRVLKVKNGTLEGPVKLAPELGSSSGKYQNPTTGEIASPEKLSEWSANGASSEQIEASARAAGFIKTDVDARILMGQEPLEVFMIVDITRFLGKEEVQEQNPEPEAKKRKK